MPLTKINFDDIVEADLNDEIEAGAPEGAQRDYKRDAYGRADADVKEFLKDVTSFANTAGGHLIIGIDEDAGIPNAKTPLPALDADTELQRLESLIASGIEPRIFGVRMKAVQIATGGVVIVIRVPQSWRPPHRVSARGSNKFYGRNSAGAFELNVEDLRMLFSVGSEATDRARAFRDDRLTKIAAGRGIAPLVEDCGRLIVHLIPASAFRLPGAVDIASAQTAGEQLRPLGDGLGYSPSINFEGFANLHQSQNGCRAYTQIFRNGVIEAVRVRAYAVPEGDDRILPSLLIEQTLIERIPAYLRAMNALGIAPPIIALISLQAIAGARLGVGENYLNEVPRISGPDLLLPDVMIENYGTDAEFHRAIKPAIDSLWNTAGILRSPHFSATGEWVGQRKRR